MCRSCDISPVRPARHPRPAYPALPFRFIAVPRLDSRRVEKGSDRDVGNERERDERAVMMEVNKVRN